MALGAILTIKAIGDRDWVQIYNEIYGRDLEGIEGGRLFFGYAVDWVKDGGLNQDDAQFLVSAVSLNASFAYAVTASLEPKTEAKLSFQWGTTNLTYHLQALANRMCVVRGLQDEECIVVNIEVSNGRVSPIVHPFTCRESYHQHVCVGFMTNGSGLFGISGNEIIGPIRPAGEIGPTTGISVATGGTGSTYVIYYDIPGDYNYTTDERTIDEFDVADGEVVQSASSPRRRVVGYPYANNGNGFVRVYQEHDMRLTGYFKSSEDGFWSDGEDAFLQLGSDIEPQLDQEQNFGFQVSMGELNSSRFAASSLQTMIGAANDTVGLVSIYEYQNSGDWDLKKPWTILGSPLQGSTPNDEFGFSVKMSASGNRLVVGAPGGGGGSAGNGYVQVFAIKGSAIVPLGNKIIEKSADGEEIFHFGYAVAVDDDRGTRMAVAGETRTGSKVFVYDFSSQRGGSWTLVGTPISGGAPGCYAAGYQKSLSFNRAGNVLVVGDVGSGESENLGRARVFEYIVPPSFEQ
jgi:hypothetical protein